MDTLPCKETSNRGRRLATVVESSERAKRPASAAIIPIATSRLSRKLRDSAFRHARLMLRASIAKAPVADHSKPIRPIAPTAPRNSRIRWTFVSISPWETGKAFDTSISIC
jgi:hypothetical protein